MQYSENMIVYTGRMALHIFDIDRERWVSNSTKIGH
jgi:predicted nucleic-acid-binding Zn-ribbon protein